MTVRVCPVLVCRYVAILLGILFVVGVVEAGQLVKCSPEHGDQCGHLSTTPVATMLVPPDEVEAEMVSCLGYKPEKWKEDYLMQLNPYKVQWNPGYLSQREQAAPGNFLIPGDVVQRGGKKLLVIGYHGTGYQHLKKFLQKGIVPVPEKKREYAAGQLGDGFYVTNSQDIAAKYCGHQKKRLILVVAVEDFCTMTGISTLSKKYKADIERAGNPNNWKMVWLINKHLVQHLLNDYDYIYGWEQLKFNRRAYPKLHIVGYYHQVPRKVPGVRGSTADCFDLDEIVNPEEPQELSPKCWHYVSTFYSSSSSSLSIISPDS
eukprot:GILK01001853.1.p1 GENE.GILK01001853.1~~GILK01001853.1.p1  ORF type:complete len:318 (-),score=38.07 GILK01001853.1:145-1098(-)